MINKYSRLNMDELFLAFEKNDRLTFNKTQLRKMRKSLLEDINDGYIYCENPSEEFDTFLKVSDALEELEVKDAIKRLEELNFFKNVRG